MVGSSPVRRISSSVLFDVTPQGIMYTMTKIMRSLCCVVEKSKLFEG